MGKRRNIGRGGWSDHDYEDRIRRARLAQYGRDPGSSVLVRVLNATDNSTPLLTRFSTKFNGTSTYTLPVPAGETAMSVAKTIHDSMPGRMFGGDLFDVYIIAPTGRKIRFAEGEWYKGW